jgi:hypothetical protein
MNESKGLVVGPDPPIPNLSTRIGHSTTSTREPYF